MKGRILNYFPGGNTALGFCSFYKYIIKHEEARRIICIKGGPGTGKSTLMKRIGKDFNEKGYDIELHHCSSDSNSIDGIVIKDLKIAMIDGTAPHVTDPIYPGAVDEVLNLGQCWNESGFKVGRDDIIRLTKEISGHFQSTYKYLAAAKLMHEDLENQVSSYLDQYKINLLERDLTKKIVKGSLEKLGFTRHLFATAFTPSGIITYIKEIIEGYENVYVLCGSPGTQKSKLLNGISTMAASKGYDVEVYHHPLIPDKIEHIIIPELDTAIVTSNEINKATFTGTQFYLENYLYGSKDSRERIAYTRLTFNTLIEKALEILNNAKKLHDQLETYYIPNMNMKELDNTYDIIIDKISSYENEKKVL